MDVLNIPLELKFVLAAKQTNWMISNACLFVWFRAYNRERSNSIVENIQKYSCSQKTAAGKNN